jgi:hypothetical protein
VVLGLSGEECGLACGAPDAGDTVLGMLRKLCGLGAEHGCWTGLEACVDLLKAGREEEEQSGLEEEDDDEDGDKGERIGVWGPAMFVNRDEEKLFLSLFSVDGIPKKDRRSQVILQRYNEYHKPAHARSES